MKDRCLCLVLCFLLFCQQAGFAQMTGVIDLSGGTAVSSAAVDKFRPLHMRALGYDRARNGFRLSLDKGDRKGTNGLDSEAKSLLSYFFIGLVLPNDAFWVNLRPDSEDNIIDPELARTDIGRILLDADVQLKKDMARFTSPDTPEGKEYWEKVYRKAEELLGNDTLEIPTLTRPWIVPGEIIIRETGDSAYIYKANLKVMLEQDHLQGSELYAFGDPRLKALNEYASQVIRERILPRLTREINVSARYAPLRQVYYSLVFAQWFKSRARAADGLLSRLIDSRRLEGLTSRVPWSKTDYFRAYRSSFARGEYDVQRAVSTVKGRSMRRYCSGGMVFNIPLSASSGAETADGGTKVIDITGKAGIAPQSDNTIDFRAEGMDVADLSSVRVTAAVRDGGAVQLPFSEQDLPGFKRFVFRKGAAFGSHLNWSGKEPLPMPHLGIDISQYEREDGSVASIREDTPVRSITSGVVLRGIPGGEEVLVLTEDNTLIRYGHIVSRVDTGDVVSPGSVIGEFRFDDRMQGRMATHLHLQASVNVDRSMPAVASALDLIAKGLSREIVRVITWNSGSRLFSFLDSDESETVDPAKLWPQLFQGADFQPDETIETGWAERDGGKSSNPGETIQRTTSEPGLSRDGGAREKEVGGVDFRALPIISQPVDPAMFRVDAADMARLGAVDLDSEREKIRKMIRAGHIPSEKRVQEYVQACCIRKSLRAQAGAILGCIADIMRLQEGKNEETSRELRDMLILLESGKPESWLLAQHP